ncbi:ribosomal L7Ae/L30e/S12e/Gadd45 family protein [Clostridium sp. CX1]|uniref:Ribosomal L7Ae/L30e/S12e/Gadd45 family protein n=1 Tax=Clostridium tanneri TaxID=3037988 RepID=A0ABU4JS99_9CLOT|nr:MULTISPECIES: ribosomal L7Ae/L30e/S12e/Gadd45 family protein [unclassified Clostridium]MCT8976817.1 ribosomal L7Ae/L30e/S12e/Gadd45 family protein [Clostridium sp. CX1]MDW8801022.1 ribosomal L7Ae/L30e/S12e/Gadd45 family protein [Clostridium sp. A1-XYC3]
MIDKFLQFLGLTKRAGKLQEGYNKCEDAIKRNNIHLIVMSSDASENTVDKFLLYGDRYKVPILRGYSKEELGGALGLPEIKILGVSDKKMSERLLHLWKEKEEL